MVRASLKKNETVSTQAQTPSGKSNVLKNESISNSAILSMRGINQASSRESMEDLESVMKSRLPLQALRNQIPAAEQEADKISSSVRGARTPDEVKARLGERMGADFSGVHLHTDSASTARAVAMGARAFTTGSDIYFGPDGFDADIAAHELVHTAQQGAVTGAFVSAHAPMGGVQMWPWSKKKNVNAPVAPVVAPAADPAAPKQGLWSRFKGGMKKIGSAVYGGAKKLGSAAYGGAKKLGSAVSRGLDKAWDVTGGRFARWNREGIDEYTEAQDNGDWGALSKGDKAKWILRNPLAWMRSQFKSNRDDARARKADYAEDDLAADTMMSGYSTGKKSSMIRGAESTEDEDQSGRPKDLSEMASDVTSEGLGIGGSISQVIDESQGLADDSSVTTGFGHAGNTLGIAKDLYALKSGWDDQKEQASQGMNRAAKRTRADMAGTVLDIGKNVAGFVGGTGAEVAGGVLGGAAGVINLATGVDQALGGRKQRTGSKEVQKDILKGGSRTREDLGEEDLNMHDISVQSAMSGRQQEIEGTGKAITGVLDATSAIAGASGAGAVAGAALTGASTAVKLGTAAASTIQHNRMKAKVTDQTIGLNDDMINKVMTARGLEDSAANRRRAKRAILRKQGYSTGFREELFRDQTVKRGKKLAQYATSAIGKKQADMSDTDRHSLDLMKSMSIDDVEQQVDDSSNPGQKKATRGYSDEAAIKALGLSGGSGDLQQLRDRNKGIAAAARARRAKSVAAVAPARGVI